MTTTFRNYSGSAAETYQQFFVPAIATPVSAGLMQAAALQEGEDVLDLACGTGVITRLAANAVGSTGSVTGVDVAPDMIEVARTIDLPAGPAIAWRQGDAASLPVPDRSQDVVLCQMGLMFMEDPAAAVADMHRVLRAGGRVVVNTPGTMQPPFEEMARAIADHIQPELGGFVRAVFSMHEHTSLRALMAEAGLGHVETTEYMAELDLPAPAEFLWQYINLTPMAPMVDGAPDSAKAAMEAQVVETWAPFVVDGRVPVAQPMVLTHARRD